MEQKIKHINTVNRKRFDLLKNRIINYALFYIAVGCLLCLILLYFFQSQNKFEQNLFIVSSIVTILTWRYRLSLSLTTKSVIILVLINIFSTDSFLLYGLDSVSPLILFAMILVSAMFFKRSVSYLLLLLISIQWVVFAFLFLNGYIDSNKVLNPNSYIVINWAFTGINFLGLAIIVIEGFEKIIGFLEHSLEDVSQQSLIIQKNNENLIKEKKVREGVERDLIKAKQVAEQSDKLKSAFLANMSHEIRTPMNAIIGFSNLLVEHELTDEKKKKFEKIIQNRGHDLLNIINDVLDISKIEAGMIEIRSSTENLNLQLKDIYQTFSANNDCKNENIKLILNNSLEDMHIHLATDYYRLRQILSNLINNAFKFTNNGVIEFGVHLADNKNFLQFYVKDTGIGIPYEKQQAVFERFTQTENNYLKPTSGGTGLGLTISKGLVELLGGNIWLISTLNKGTTIYFTLPFHEAEYLNDENAIIIEENNDLSSLRVLIVEDDAANMEYISEVLIAVGCNISCALSAERALEIIKTTDIDLILLDIRLPDMDGFTLYKYIQKEHYHLKVIAITAFASVDDEILCKEAGFHSYLSKPFKKELLYNQIKKVMKL